MLIPVILSGGAGTRLWPVSRASHPKPFMTLADGDNLLQKTLKRALALETVHTILTVTNQDYFFQSRDSFQAVSPAASSWEAKWLLEPVGRNTAPAILCAALALAAEGHEEAIMLVLPADHLIGDQAHFQQAVTQAMALAAQDYLVTFGIMPTHPDTGFGYIEQGAAVTENGYHIARFVEKPDLETAQTFLKTEQYLWNAGLFCMRVGAVLTAFQTVAPTLLAQAQQCWQATCTTSQPITFAASFAALPDISFDYAIMEHYAKTAVVRACFDWSDVGSWTAIQTLATKDAAGNHIEGEAYLYQSQNCYIRGSHRFIAGLGLHDLLIVDTPDALLVAHQQEAQAVKNIVAHLKQQQHPSYRDHVTMHRPWGTYTVLETGDRFKIKRLVVKPKARLSLQLHYHRNEHWIVVSGTAQIQNGTAQRLLLTNQSTYIEAGTPHRLENPGMCDLVMIEVQSGAYLGEDDIVRFDDQYGRE